MVKTTNYLANIANLTDADLESIRKINMPTTTAVGDMRKILSGLPGLDPKTYRSLAAKADEGSKLNAALALMQAGFSSMGATPQEGETPFATVGRTLLAPLSAGLGKVASEKRASQEKYKLAEMAAEGKLSSTAFNAVLGGNKETNALILGLIKAKKTGLTGTVYDLVDNTGKIIGQRRIGERGNVYTLDNKIDKNAGNYETEGKRLVKQFKKPEGGRLDTGIFNVLENGKVTDVQVRTTKAGGLVEVSSNKRVTLGEGQTLSPITASATTRKGINSPEFQPVHSSFKSQLQAFSKEYSKTQAGNIFRKNGKWMYYDNNLNEKEVPETGQKSLDKQLKEYVYALHPNFGKGLQVSETQTLKVPSIIAENFFLRSNAMVQPWGRNLFDGFDLSTEGQKTRYNAVLKNTKDTDTSPQEAYKALRSPDFAKISRWPLGRMVDAAQETNILNQDSLTLGKTEDINNRLAYEIMAQRLPGTDTDLNNANATNSAQRVDIVRKAAANETAKMQKKWDKPENIKQTERWQAALRSIKLINGIHKNMALSNVTGFVTGPIKKVLTNIGIPEVDPSSWFKTEEGKQAQKDYLAEVEILNQLVGRGLLKESGDSRFSDKDLSGIQKVLGSINNDGEINSLRLKSLKRLFMNGLKSSAKRLGTFNVKDTEIEDAIKLGLDRSILQADSTAPVFYSKYLNPFKYKVTKQDVPVVNKQDSDRLEVRGVIELFSSPGTKRVNLQRAGIVNGALQPVQVLIGGRPSSRIVVDIDTLFDKAQENTPLGRKYKNLIDLNYGIFKKKAGM